MLLTIISADGWPPAAWGVSWKFRFVLVLVFEGEPALIMHFDRNALAHFELNL